MVDSFFTDPSKKKKRNKTSSTVQSNNKKRKVQRSGTSNHDSDDDDNDNSVSDIDEEEAQSDIFDSSDDEKEGSDIDEGDEEEENKTESAADKRRRLAKQYLEDLKLKLGADSLGPGYDNDDNENSNNNQENYEFDAKDLDDEIIRSRLKKDVAEQKGYVYKFYGDKLNLEEKKQHSTRVSNIALTSLSVRYPYLYTTTKDIELSKWDIKDSTKHPNKVKSVKGGSKYTELNKEHAENNHFDEIFTCVTSPDGKYIVTGGKDNRIIVWSTNSLSCIRVLETRNNKGQVLGLAFRRNTDQLYAACADLKIRTYSINQLAQLETLYGHQDIVVDISALGLERCVTVGSRDRTAMLWKISEETRLTFRGGDSIEKYGRKKKRYDDNNNIIINEEDEKKEPFFFEGSIDCVSMIDDSHFVTGSDNGNISLWSLSKKKPLFTKRLSHGIQPKEKASQASAESNEIKASEQIPEPQPFWITSIHSVPYSDIFITGSWDGKLKIWKLDESIRNFELLGELDAKGIVTRIDSYDDEEKGELRIYATLSKEHRLGRWIKPLPGSRNALFSCIINFN